MFWIVLTFLAVLFLTGAILIDNFIITQEVKDPFLTTVIAAIVIFFFLIVVSLPLPKASFSLTHVVGGLAAGVVYVAVLWFYFYTLSKEEVSRAAPVFATSPLFVLPFGFFFFGEVFNIFKYAGVVLIVVGAVLLSFKKTVHKLRFDKMIFLGLFTAFLFALRAVCVKFATLKATIWSVLPWIGVGGFVSAFIVFVFHHPRIIKKARHGWIHLALTGLFTGLGMFLLFTAISIGPVSLVMALLGLNTLFVDISAMGLSIYYPQFIDERLTPGILVQKIVATVLVVTGGALVVF